MIWIFFESGEPFCERFQIARGFVTEMQEFFQLLAGDQRVQADLNSLF